MQLVRRSLPADSMQEKDGTNGPMPGLVSSSKERASHVDSLHSASLGAIYL